MIRIEGGIVGAVLVAALALPAASSAHSVLYGSPGAEQAQLQQWIDESHAPTPNVPVRLYEGNCEEDRPEGSAPERHEEPGQEASPVQSCAALTEAGATPTARNEAVYFPHMEWHPQYPALFWHLNLLNELGHTYDNVFHGRGGYRKRFSRIYDYNPRWWFPVNTAAALNTEWEKWAMAFALCGDGLGYAEANGLIQSGEYAGFGYEPTAGQYARTCRLIGELSSAHLRPRHRRRRL